MRSQIKLLERELDDLRRDKRWFQDQLVSIAPASIKPLDPSKLPAIIEGIELPSQRRARLARESVERKRKKDAENEVSSADSGTN